MGKQQGVMIFQDKTVSEYLLMEDKSLIDMVLQNVKPKRNISIRHKGKYFEIKPRVNDLFEIEYKWIIKIKQEIGQANLNAVKEILSGIYSITENQFYNCSVFDVFAAFAWVVEEIENVLNAEKEKLFKKPSQKQLAAGIDEFEQLEDIPAIDGIAGGDVTKWNAILELPYGQVMRKMLLNKITNEYNERYSKLK